MWRASWSIAGAYVLPSPDSPRVYRVEAHVGYAGARVARAYRVVARTGREAIGRAQALARREHLAWLDLTGLAILMETDG